MMAAIPSRFFIRNFASEIRKLKEKYEKPSTKKQFFAFITQKMEFYLGLLASSIEVSFEVSAMSSVFYPHYTERSFFVTRVHFSFKSGVSSGVRFD